MSKIQTLFRLMRENPRQIKSAAINSLAKSGKLNILSDKQYLKLRFKATIGKKLNLKDPKTFNEKLQWIKLYDRRPEYITLVDKYAVRQWIAERIGQEYLVPLLGKWDRAEDIDFDSLPDQFVLKCNHDSGGVVVCKNAASFDREAAREKLARQLKKNLYWWGREWPYKNVKPCIIAEQYLEDESGDLLDYKFMCFNGQVKCSFICSDRFSGKGLHVTFFDLDWNVMPFERHYPRVKEGLPKPKQYEKMLQLATELSRDIPFVRVDFYEVNGQVYFGEMTLFPGCGFEEFTPESWDETLGSWIQLPPKTEN